MNDTFGPGGISPTLIVFGVPAKDFRSPEMLCRDTKNGSVAFVSWEWAPNFGTQDDWSWHDSYENKMRVLGRDVGRIVRPRR